MPATIARNTTQASCKAGSVSTRSSRKSEKEDHRTHQDKDDDKDKTRPAFDSLPLKKGDPKGSAWGLWGDDDEVGTLNLLTSQVTKAASEEVQTGRVVSLNLSLHQPVIPMNPRRAPCTHHIIAKGYANDDEICLNTQSSSHWDGLRHYPYQNTDIPLYYNGTTQEDIDGSRSAAGRIGIQNIAQRGIVGRGVLLDWRAWAESRQVYRSPFENNEIPLSELREVAACQNITFRPGDILLIRSGWTKEYKGLSPDEQVALAQREKRSFIGVEGSREMMQWHWDMQFAAVAGDTNAYEAWPPKRTWGVSCHEVFLSGWGMPIGELWDLETLSEVCQDLQRWTFMLTSCPLNLFGGVASPANAIATF